MRTFPGGNLPRTVIPSLPPSSFGEEEEVRLSCEANVYHAVCTCRPPGRKLVITLGRR